MLQIDLTGRIAVVTGATGQLGRVIARTLAACGADVALHYYQNHEKARALQAEIEALGRRACIVQADVGDEASVLAMRDEIGRALGAPEIVVACAVSQYAWKPVLDQPTADYLDQFNTCVLHNVLMAKAFLPAMYQRGGGRYIGVNTECAAQCLPTQSAYAAAKRGMDGVLRVLAREAGEHGVTVNQVAPGWTISERERVNGMGESAAYIKNVPLGRRGEDTDIANAVAFLASDLAAFITGVYLPVCGGAVMPGI